MAHNAGIIQQARNIAFIKSRNLGKIKAKGELSSEDLEKEKKLIHDMEWVGKHIEKEVHDIEKLMRG